MEIKKLLDTIYKKALKVALAKSPYKISEFSHIAMYDGELVVVFYFGRRGHCEEIHVDVSLEDLDKSVEILTQEFEESERSRKEEIEKKKAEKKQKDAEEKDASELALYKKLRDKFESK